MPLFGLLVSLGSNRLLHKEDWDPQVEDENALTESGTLRERPRQLLFGLFGFADRGLECEYLDYLSLTSASRIYIGYVLCIILTICGPINLMISVLRALSAVANEWDAVASALYGIPSLASTRASNIIPPILYLLFFICGLGATFYLVKRGKKERSALVVAEAVFLSYIIVFGYHESYGLNMPLAYDQMYPLGK